MRRIKQILGADDHGDYCIVYVLLDNDEEAEVYVGGEVEAYLDPKHGKYKAYIKRRKGVGLDS